MIKISKKMNLFSSAAICLLFMAQNSLAAKPSAAKPPPPPAAGCATGVFPSVAYTTPVYSRRGAVTGYEINLGNSLGNCSVKLFTTQALVFGFSYHYSAGQGRIVWSQVKDDNSSTNRPVVKMLSFSMSGTNLTQGVPLAASVIYSDPLSSGVNVMDVDLSSSGDRVAYLRGAANGLQEIGAIDVSSCTSNCLKTIFRSESNIDVQYAISWSPNDSELYYTARASGGSTSIFAITDLGSAWSAPRTIASVSDPLYSSGSYSFRSLSVTALDLNNDNVDELVLAVGALNMSGNVDEIDVFDISLCASSTGAGSCLSNGDISVINTSIAGAQPGWASDGSLLRSLNGNVQSINPITRAVMTNFGAGTNPEGSN